MFSIELSGGVALLYAGLLRTEEKYDNHEREKTLLEGKRNTLLRSLIAIRSRIRHTSPCGSPFWMD